MHALRTTLTVLLLPALWQASLPAAAQASPGLRLEAGTTVTHDSNLFRLPAGASALALTGKDSAADTIAITTLGVAYDKSYSLQHIELAASLADYHHQNYGNLSFTALNYNAAWHWSLTPALQGKLSQTRRDTLNSYADYNNYTQANQRTQSDTRLEAEYQLDGAWRALAGFAHSKQTNQQTLQAEADYTADSTHAGMRYALASGSALSYRLSNTSGSYLNRVLPSVGLYDSGFSETSNQFGLIWVISDQASAIMNASHISRTHANYAQRNYSGTTASAVLNWSLTGKAGLSVSWTRELSSYLTATSNYSQTDRLAIKPSFQLGAKTVLRAHYELAQRDYLGTPFGPVAAPRNDTTRETSLSIDWRPWQALTFSAALQNSRRDSNLTGLDYSSNQAKLSAQYSY